MPADGVSCSQMTSDVRNLLERLQLRRSRIAEQWVSVFEKISTKIRSVSAQSLHWSMLDSEDMIENGVRWIQSIVEMANEIQNALLDEQFSELPNWKAALETWLLGQHRLSSANEEFSGFGTVGWEQDIYSSADKLECLQNPAVKKLRTRIDTSTDEALDIELCNDFTRVQDDIRDLVTRAVDLAKCSARGTCFCCFVFSFFKGEVAQF